nr:MAG TPA: hypothetical protein [Caudoviricetes sp.]
MKLSAPSRRCRCRSNAIPLISRFLRHGGKRISFRTLRAIARKNVINLSQLRR